MAGHLHLTMVNVHIPSGEDGEAMEIAMEGTPWKSNTIVS